MIRPDTRIAIRVQSENFDLAAEMERFGQGRSDAGAVVSFTGICRDEDGRLEALELEHYAEMAERQLRRIAEEAAQRWNLIQVTIVHRHGRIPVGEKIVFVATSATHRQAAFGAAAFIMDFLKTRAPFWKKEHPRGQGQGDWVAARAEDDEAAGRWQGGS